MWNRHFVVLFLYCRCTSHICVGGGCRETVWGGGGIGLPDNFIFLYCLSMAACPDSFLLHSGGKCRCRNRMDTNVDYWFMNWKLQVEFDCWSNLDTHVKDGYKLGVGSWWAKNISKCWFRIINESKAKKLTILQFARIHLTHDDAYVLMFNKILILIHL